MKDEKSPDLENLPCRPFLIVEAEQLPSGMRKVTVQCDNPQDALWIIDAIMPGPAPIPTVQQKYRHIYQLLAFGSGFVFLVTILAIAVFISTPTTFQIRVFLSVLALSAGAFGVVITGLLDVKASVGKQVRIGATGALALVVLMLFVDPS